MKVSDLFQETARQCCWTTFVWFIVLDVLRWFGCRWRLKGRTISKSREGNAFAQQSFLLGSRMLMFKFHGVVCQFFWIILPAAVLPSFPIW
jgi:hypothetical protein